MQVIAARRSFIELENGREEKQATDVATATAVQIMTPLLGLPTGRRPLVCPCAREVVPNYGKKFYSITFKNIFIRFYLYYLSYDLIAKLKNRKSK